MGNLSYNGRVLPAFPTDFGAYSASYLYRVILYYSGVSCYYAMASSQPFEIIRTSGGSAILRDPAGHGEQYLDVEDLEEGGTWVDHDYDLGYWDPDELNLHKFQVIWTNHDLVNQTDGSLYQAAGYVAAPGSAVTGVTVNAPPMQLNRGESFQFTAGIEGTGGCSAEVDFTLSGHDARGGTTLSREGLLTVGEAEYASVLTVTVTSRQNPSAQAVVTVTVADHRSKLTLTADGDLMDYNGTVLPDFPTDFGAYTGQYPYRLIVWCSERLRWYAVACAEPCTVQRSAYGYAQLNLNLHGEYHLDPDEGDTEWVHVGDSYSTGLLRAANFPLVWANHDLIYTPDGTVFFPASEPVVLSRRETEGEEAVCRIFGSAVWLDLACADLNETEAVYTVKLWLYRQQEGLNTSLPPTWTGETFAGPAWAGRVSLTDLAPFTDYGVYAVICVNGEATDHHAAARFSTAQGDAGVALSVTAGDITPDGCTLAVTCSGLEAETDYTAEVTVHYGGGQVAFFGELTFTGSGTRTLQVTGLEPETLYTVSVDVYPALTGEIAVRGDFPFTTAGERAWGGIFAGVGGTARPVRAVYVGVKGRARAVKSVYVGVADVARPLKRG